MAEYSLTATDNIHSRVQMISYTKRKLSETERCRIVTDRASDHTRNATFEAVFAPEQEDCCASLVSGKHCLLNAIVYFCLISNGKLKYVAVRTRTMMFG